MSTNSEGIAHFSTIIDFDSDFFAGILIFVGPLAYAVAITALAAWSVLGYLAAAILGPLALFYCSCLDFFARTTRFYPYRPNLYIDMYDDPLSRHWLQAGVSQTLIVEPAETNLLSTH